MARIKMVCSHCGSENVRYDAWAEWDFDNQQWTLGEMFDETFCMDCDAETTIEELFADPTE